MSTFSDLILSLPWYFWLIIIVVIVLLLLINIDGEPILTIVLVRSVDALLKVGKIAVNGLISLITNLTWRTVLLLILPITFVLSFVFGLNNDDVTPLSQSNLLTWLTELFVSGMTEIWTGIANWIAGLFERWF